MGAHQPEHLDDKTQRFEGLGRVSGLERELSPGSRNKTLQTGLQGSPGRYLKGLAKANM